MKSILVARVSTEEQREANNSLPAQMVRMEEYCRRNGLEVAGRYSFDESAYKDKRDEFDKIIADIECQKEKVAVCFDKVDRLSRNIFDKRVSILYEKALNNRIELHFVSDAQVINEGMSAGDKFAFGMKLGLSKYYSDAISDNVKRAFEQKRRKGEWTWPAKLGYINTIDESWKNTVIPDPERKHLVIRIFELYATGGYSMFSLKQEMDKLGLLSRKGFKISTSKVEDILKDPFYHGMTQSEKFWVYPHKYARLITKDLFERCQEVRKGKQGRPEKGVVGREFIFGGVMKCKNCGCSISPEVKTKKSGKEFIYYSCTNAKHVCRRDYVNENTLLEPVHGVLSRFRTITPQAQEFLLKEMRKDMESDVTFNRAQLSKIQREIANLEIAEKNLLKKFIDPTARITQEMYDTIHQENQDQIERLKHETKKYSELGSEYETSLVAIVSLAQRAKDIFESSEVEEKKLLIRFLFQNPTLDRGKPLFDLRSPFDLVLDLDDSNKWLPE